MGLCEGSDVMKIVEDFKRARARGAQMRPWWQIAYLLPLYLITMPMRALLRWLDEQ